MGKYRDYANLKTSIQNRSKKQKDTRINFKPVLDAGKNMGNELLDAGKTFVDDVATGLGFKSGADSKAADQINKVLKAAGSAGDNPVDARSTAVQSKIWIEVQQNARAEIALIQNLSMINALPPIPDNIVDPPPIWEKNLVKRDLDSWSSGLIGKDYLQRVIARGQFLTLVPLDISPKLLGNTVENIKSAGKQLNAYRGLGEASNGLLTSLNNRLNNASYGLVAKVNSTKYFKAVNAHMKAALMSLGIDIDVQSSDFSSAKLAMLRKYLPDEIVERMIGQGSPVMNSIVGQLKGSGENASDKQKQENTVKFESTDNNRLFEVGENGKLSTIKTTVNVFGEDYTKSVESTAGTVKTTELPEDVVRKNNYNNLLKYLLNIDEGDEENKKMPFSCFYCNGPIDRGISTSSSLGESEIARMTTDVGHKIMGQNIADGVATFVGGAPEEYIKEMAYHRNLGGFLVANTYIPNVIKSAMLDMQYTVNIRDVAVSSDRFSIARLFWTLSQLWPFVIQTNEPGQALVVPSAPMYCSAFSKGIMNLPRAAITSMNIKTSPEFQTTEGIPTELDISITIQPLFNQSTMPNFSKFYDGTNYPEYVAAALFNPNSSFNIIATMCGQNTILTKFQAGLLGFFIGGTISTFFNSIKNTGSLLSGAWSDWWSSADIMRNEVFSRTRILG